MTNDNFKLMALAVAALATTAHAEVNSETLQYDDPISIVTVCTSNEYLPDGEGYLGCDWVEIRNTSSAAVNVGGYSIGKKKTFCTCRDAGEIAYLPSLSLGARQSAYVFFDSDLAEQSGWSTTPDGRVCHRSASFNLGEGDNVRLYNKVGARVTNWTSGDNSPAAPALAKIAVNEVCYKNSNVADGEGYSDGDWVELYNYGTVSVELGGLSLGKKRDVKSCGSALATLPKLTLAPRKFALVFLNKNRAAQSSWVTDSSGNVSIRLAAFNLGTTTDDTGATVQDSVRLFDSAWRRLANVNGSAAAGELAKNTSWGTTTDGDMSAFQVYPSPTPWASNGTAPLVLPTVAVNEICYKNSTVADSEGNVDCDWVELYNFGGEAVDLAGFALGKKKSYDECVAAGAICVLPSLVLEPQSFAVVFLNSARAAQSSWTTNSAGLVSIRSAAFNLGKTTDDETGVEIQDSVRLFAADQVHSRLSNVKGSAAIGILPSDNSYGYLTDGSGLESDLYRFSEMTPGGPNAPGLYLPPPNFSVAAGRYDDAREVAMTNSYGFDIRYTLDGTDPRTSPYAITVRSGASVSVDERAAGGPSAGDGRTNAWIRTSPVELDDNVAGAGWAEPIGSVARVTPLRAVTVSGSRFSEEKVASYFIGSGFASRSVAQVAVTVDPDSFFGDEGGIYVPGAVYAKNGYGSNKWGKPNANYYATDEAGDDWERPGHIELLEPEGDATALSFNLGYAMHGGGTRSLPKKALYCLLRGDYGVKAIDYPLFGGSASASYRRFMLRNNGNDFYGPYWQGVSTHLKDATLHRLVESLDISTMASRPAVVWVNGDYWGLHNIRETIDKHYYASRYGLDADNIDLLSHVEASSDWDKKKVKIERIDGDKSSDEEYEAFLDEIAEMRGTQEIYELAAKTIDITNYIDYVAAEIFFANTDWPCNNCDFWRAHTNEVGASRYGDGRWRWTLYDLDLAGCKVQDCGGRDYDMFEFLDLNGNKYWQKTDTAPYLMCRLMRKVPSFKNGFIDRYLDLLNSTFKPERTERVIRESAELVRSEVERDYLRWGRTFGEDDWSMAVNTTLVDFVEARWSCTYTQLINYFGLGSPGNLTVANADATGAGGHFEVGSLVIETTTPGVTSRAAWTGRYATGRTVTIRAVPDEGYEFDGWVGSGEAASVREVSVSADSTVVFTARFRRSGTPAYAASAYESWQIASYGEQTLATNPAAAEPGAIAATSGIAKFSNLQLYAFGMSPNDNLTDEERKRRMSLDITGGETPTLSYCRTAGDDASLDFGLQVADSPGGAWRTAEIGCDIGCTAVTDATDSAYITVTVPLKSSSPSKYYRLEVKSNDD